VPDAACTIPVDQSGDGSEVILRIGKSSQIGSKRLFTFPGQDGADRRVFLQDGRGVLAGFGTTPEDGGTRADLG